MARSVSQFFVLAIIAAGVLLPKGRVGVLALGGHTKWHLLDLGGPLLAIEPPTILNKQFLFVLRSIVASIGHFASPQLGPTSTSQRLGTLKFTQVAMISAARSASAFVLTLRANSSCTCSMGMMPSLAKATMAAFV